MHTTTSYGDPETRTRILEAARTLLDQQGPTMTMAQVADAAGVSRQAVYKHVGDRSGLMVQLVAHLDEALGLGELAQAVHDAPTGREALAAMVGLHATFHERIIGFARQAEALRHSDPAVAAAWEDRMAGRREAHRGIVQRLAEEAELAPGWDVESAAMVFYTVTLPRTWDELVVERGWSTAQYREHMTRLLTRALVNRP